jgi:F-type H+-transporting ATPase subunit b
VGIFSLNATLIAELLLFAIVVIVIAKVVIPPLRNAMAERQSVISKGLADAEAAEARLAEAELEYERRLSRARQEGREILDAYRAMAATTLAEAQQRARRELAAAVTERD